MVISRVKVLKKDKSIIVKSANSHKIQNISCTNLHLTAYEQVVFEKTNFATLIVLKFFSSQKSSFSFLII